MSHPAGGYERDRPRSEFRSTDRIFRGPFRRSTTDANGGLECDVSVTVVDREGAVRTVGDLDPSTWRTLCCPGCGARSKTVFVGG